jgi:PAS domain S-box-containing protein
VIRPATPANEGERLVDLRRLCILDTAAEERFDRITRLAARVLDVPIALVSLVDADRQWFKSRVGLDATETPRDVSFCGHAILGSEIFVVPDALADERFADNPLVTQPPAIRFYAGHPLIGLAGHPIGTLCIIDTHPRQLSATDLQTLKDLAAVAEYEIKLIQVVELTETLRQSEERYRDVVENSRDLISTHDLQGIILTANRAMVEATGYALDELVGHNLRDLLAPDICDRFGDYLGVIAKEGRARGLMRIVTKEGHERILEYHNSLRSEEHAPPVVRGLARDVTEQIRAQQALKENEERLDLALRGDDLGTWDWDIRTDRVIFNDRWATMLEYDPSEIEPDAEVWRRLVHPDDMPAARRALEDHLEGRTPFYRVQQRLRTRSGNWKWIQDHGKVFLRDEQGRPLRAVGIQRDISREKDAETALQVALEALRKSHDDLLTVLNQLRVGVVTVEADGRVSFLSEFCETIEGIDRTGAHGRPWEEVVPFDIHAREAIQEAMLLPAPRRTRLALNLQAPSGRTYFLECEVHDDPSAPGRHIFFLYDVTETQELKVRLDRAGPFRLVGNSRAMTHLYEMIQRVAEGDWTVLIEGETGVGKELVARAVHAASLRRHGPFIAVNCGGLTESLLASQLFGHRKGAFTGAIADQEGFFQAATAGTVFLDEIGDLPLTMQTSLLRVLQEREIIRVGESRARPVDVRVLAATHRDLAQMVIEGRFREDLLYRVRVARLRVPPLRERKEDLPLLVSAFLAESRISAGKPAIKVSVKAMQHLSAYDWPGNVRELKHAIEYAVIHAQSSVLQPSDFPPEISRPPAMAPEAPKLPVGDERTQILAAFKIAKENRAQAAKILGISRSTLYRRIRELGL